MRPAEDENRDSIAGSDVPHCFPCLLRAFSQLPFPVPSPQVPAALALVAHPCCNAVRDDNDFAFGIGSTDVGGGDCGRTS